MLHALLAAPLGWVTQMQSKYGVQASHRVGRVVTARTLHGSRQTFDCCHCCTAAWSTNAASVGTPLTRLAPRMAAMHRGAAFAIQASHAAAIWAGEVNDTGSQIYQTMGYYWHSPTDADSNRGLGGGIQWAWDDSLCAETRAGYNDDDDGASRPTITLEEQFKEDLLFARFVSCAVIKAALHRAFKVWEDMHQHIRFVDVNQHGQHAFLAASPGAAMCTWEENIPRRRTSLPCAPSARAWRLWAASYSQSEAQPLCAQPLTREPKGAASKVAHFTAFERLGYRGVPPTVQPHGQSAPHPPLVSGPNRLLHLPSRCLVAPCSLAPPGWAPATGAPAARASRLQSRAFHLRLTIQVWPRAEQLLAA